MYHFIVLHSACDADRYNKLVAKLRQLHLSLPAISPVSLRALATASFIVYSPYFNTYCNCNTRTLYTRHSPRQSLHWPFYPRKLSTPASRKSSCPKSPLPSRSWPRSTRDPSSYQQTMSAIPGSIPIRVPYVSKLKYSLDLQC